MFDSTITSANSIFTLIVADLFPAPVQMEGYSTDSAVVTDAIDMAEVQMGVDGRMTAGYVPNPTKQTIALQADSPSRPFFTAILEATKTAKEIYYLTGNLILTGTGEAFALTRGVITNAKQIPDLKKVLDPVDIVITWESINPTVV
jgi:hypothetical protein